MTLASAFWSLHCVWGFRPNEVGCLHTRQFVLDVATDEVIADAGFLIEHTVGLLTETLDAALGGARLPTSPVEHAQQYDRDAIAEQAVTAYQRAVDGGW